MMYRRETDPDHGLDACIQVETNLWVLMREDKRRPKAVVRRYVAVDGVEQFLLFTWHSDPSQQRLVRMFDTLLDASQHVPWNNPQFKHPSRGEYPNMERMPGLTKREECPTPPGGHRPSGVA